MGRNWRRRNSGGPESSPFFCVAIQPAVRRLDERCRAAGGMAKFGMDDGYAIGPAEVILDAVRRFGEEVREQCLLELEWSKSEVFSWDGVLPAGCPDGITLAGEEIEGTFQPGFLCYGVPVGTPEYATSQLFERARKIAKDANSTVELLGGERQALWASLKWSISQRFDYWCQLSYPTDLQPAAAWLDSQLWRVLEAAVGTHIPQGEEGKGWECVLPVPVGGREGRSFASWVVRLPIRLGGWGFRSLVETSLVPFVGAVEQSVPTFTGPGGICPQLSDYLGGEESFGQREWRGGKVDVYAGEWREGGGGVSEMLGKDEAGGSRGCQVDERGGAGGATERDGSQCRKWKHGWINQETGDGAAGAGETQASEQRSVSVP